MTDCDAGTEPESAITGHAVKILPARTRQAIGRYYLAAMMLFTLATGLREAHVVRLEWSQIDRDRRCAWIHANQAKARKAIAVPLNDDALQVLHQQAGKHPLRVFIY